MFKRESLCFVPEQNENDTNIRLPAPFFFCFEKGQLRKNKSIDINVTRIIKPNPIIKGAFFMCAWYFLGK